MNYDILVNKDYRLPPDYIPADLISAPIAFDAAPGDPKRLLRVGAARAVKHLIAYAHHEQMLLIGISGYRSYARQQEIFDASLKRAGAAHTEQYIAHLVAVNIRPVWPLTCPVPPWALNWRKNSVKQKKAAGFAVMRPCTDLFSVIPGEKSISLVTHMNLGISAMSQNHSPCI